MILLQRAPWQWRPGYLNGLRQPVLIARLYTTAVPSNSEPFLELPGGIHADALLAAGDERSGIDRLFAILASAYAALPGSLRYPCFAEPAWKVDADNQGAIALPSLDPTIDRRGAELAIAIVNQLTGAKAPDFDLEASLAALRHEMTGRVLPGINNWHLRRAAFDLGIDLMPAGGDALQFGLGASSRVLFSTMSERTSGFAAHLAKNKHHSASLLAARGLPVPHHYLVTSAAEATAAADAIGYPVVVKPIDLDQGTGVSAWLNTPSEVDAAYARASAVSAGIMVQRHHDGDDVRLTVAEGQIIKAMKRRAAGVVGDGVHGISALVALLDASPETAVRALDPGFKRLTLDAEAMEMLGGAGLGPGTVLAAGQFQPLRRRGNASSGGAILPLAVADVHPDNCALALAAARSLRLDIAGIDLIVSDIRRSWREVGGVILEINAMPQIGSLDSPDIYRDLLALMLPSLGKISATLVVVPDGLEALTEVAMGSFAAKLGVEGLSCRHGNWHDGRRSTLPFRDGFKAARALLSDPAIRSAAMLMPASELLQLGLPVHGIQRVLLLEIAETPPEMRALMTSARTLALDHLARLAPLSAAAA